VHHSTGYSGAAHRATVASQAGMGAQLVVASSRQSGARGSAQRLSLGSQPTLPADEMHARVVVQSESPQGGTRPRGSRDVGASARHLRIDCGDGLET
jgi:hypothetical protein